MQKTDSYAQKQQYVESLIATEHYYHVPDSTCVLCALVLKSGFTVTGTSFCLNPVDFNAAKGWAFARDSAINEAIHMESYLCYQGAGSTNALGAACLASGTAECGNKEQQKKPYEPVTERLSVFNRLVSAIRAEFTEAEMRGRGFDESMWQAAQIIRWAQVEG
ncbi:hypothetical protein FOT62_22740 [Serratia marcescens]|uniref:Uncharacterized protein n=1 Tax=Serratia marcescens TaxID=615 RepID=A0A5C7BT30_SERMA|nr:MULTISPECIES: Gp49 family protein [Serratia]TXE27140.1 hypothetical protein FOT62_22740 [Serratia marcescens]TXE55303.1 hypothetical protein FOT56_25425 [Serratia marcescens]